WTWEEFVETAKKLTFTRPNGEKVYGFAGFIDAGVINTWGLWMNEDPSVRPVINGKFGFNNEKTAAALRRFAELALVHKVTPPDFGALKDADVKGGFKNKQYAMVVDATGFSPQLKKDGINFAIYPLPSYKGNRLTVGAIGLIAVAATNDKEKERAAMDLARYLTSAEVQEDVPPSETAATGFYLAPAARRSVKVAPPLDEFVPMLDYMWITPLTPAWPKLTRLFHTEYQNIIFGKADPAEAMARIASEADALLAQQP
ncbi:MAG: extracellular solute-binding protein, partial [Thermoflexales bacterium]|nr:extracellular solute-binding protein [Thermoflexales bacterium]